MWMGTSKQPVTLVHEARFTEGSEAEGAAGVKSRLGGGGGWDGSVTVTGTDGSQPRSRKRVLCVVRGSLRYYASYRYRCASLH